MKSKKKCLWIALVFCTISFITVLGIEQAKYREWELRQPEIKISAREAVQAFEEAGVHFESIEDTTGKVSKAQFGEPLAVFLCTLMQEKMDYVSVFEYWDWKDAKHTIDYQIDFRETNSINYKGAMFSHGALAIFIFPPNESLNVQLQEILMARFNLPKQESQSK